MIETLVVKDYTNEILEFQTISIWIIYKKLSCDSCECCICLKSLQKILSIPTHASMTSIQINHLCYFIYDYLMWHLVKMTSSCINNYKVVCNCTCNSCLWLMSLGWKWQYKIHSYHPFLVASQKRWKYNCL